jgi:hypothetical protein
MLDGRFNRRNWRVSPALPKARFLGYKAGE